MNAHVCELSMRPYMYCSTTPEQQSEWADAPLQTTQSGVCRYSNNISPRGNTPCLLVKRAFRALNRAREPIKWSAFPRHCISLSALSALSFLCSLCALGAQSIHSAYALSALSPVLSVLRILSSLSHMLPSESLSLIN